MKTTEKEFQKMARETTDHPNDIYNKGLLYDTLKKEYDKLWIKNDQVLAKSLKAEIQRDKCIEALEEIKLMSSQSKDRLVKIIYSYSNQTLKNNEK